MSKIPFDECCSKLGQLTRSELLELRSILDDLLSVNDEDLLANDSPDREKEPKRVASGGHLEWKKIRGYGPYLYIRRWAGKTLTSTYLGKGRS